MTISTQARVAEYIGNGVATVFPYGFPIYESEHVEIRLYNRSDNTYAVIPEANYSITGVGPDSVGGAVTYNPGGIPIPSTQLLWIARTVPYEQDTSIRNQSGFYPAVIERQLDLIVMQVQQLAEQLSRAVVLPPTGDVDLDDVVALILQINAIIDEIVIVAGIAGDVTSVAGNAADISAVAANGANVTAVAGNETNINNVAANAANINTVAALSAAVASLAAVADKILEFNDLYLGSGTSFPLLDNEGDPLQEGALFWLKDDPTPANNTLWGYIDGVWTKAGTTAGTIEQWGSIVATAGQTDFTIPGGYVPGAIRLYINGRRLHRIGPSPGTGPTDNECTASNGTTVVFPAGVIAEDDIFGYDKLTIVELLALLAANVSFTPAGGVAATTVQAAIEELDSEKAALVHTHIVGDVTGLQAALDAKAPLASPALTGVPTAPTPALGTNTTQLATMAALQAAIANLLDSAPGALDTLNELAAALGDDPNFATTMTNALALKAPLASPALTGTPTAPTAGLGNDTTQLATTAFVQQELASLPGGVDPGSALVDSDVLGAAAATIDIALTGGFREYKLCIPYMEPVSSGASARAQISVDGGSTYLATAYRFGGRYDADNATGGTLASAAGTGIALSGVAQAAAAGLPGEFEITLTMPAASGRETSIRASTNVVNTSSISAHTVVSGRRSGTTTRPTHVRILYDSGNVAIGAEWQLYGLRA